MSDNHLMAAAIITAIVAILSATTANHAAACNRTAGCTMDTLLENDEMMRSEGMSKAMRAGQDNIDAFRKLQASERAAALGVPPNRSRKAR